MMVQFIPTATDCPTWFHLLHEGDPILIHEGIDFEEIRWVSIVGGPVKQLYLAPTTTSVNHYTVTMATDVHFCKRMCRAWMGEFVALAHETNG